MIESDAVYKAEINRLLVVKGVNRRNVTDGTGLDIYRYLDKDVSMQIDNMNVVLGYLLGLPDKE